MRISVSAQGMTSGALQRALNEGVGAHGESMTLELEPAPMSTRSVDPTVLVAIVSGASTALNALVIGLFSLAQGREGRKVVIQASTGARLEAPTSMTPDELDAWIASVQKVDVAHIHLAG